MLASISETPVEVRTMQSRILIADDQLDVLRALCLLLKGHGYTTETVTSPADLLEALQHSEFDLLLMDLNYARDTTSGREGLDLLTRLKANAGARAARIGAPRGARNASTESNRFAVSRAGARNCGSARDSRRISAQRNRATRGIRNCQRVAISPRSRWRLFRCAPL